MTWLRAVSARAACIGVRLAAGALVAVMAVAPAVAQDDAIFPAPASLRHGEGAYLLRERASVQVPPGDAGAASAARLLSRWLTRMTALQLDIGDGRAAPADIRFERTATGSDEDYRLSITPRGVRIAAHGDAGLLYGAVSLLQMATAGDQRRDGGIRLAAAEITDAPRFRWRGLMLDSARHLQSVGFIHDLLDAMAISKLNVFHWHLVDDQGWRLEIRKYPRLTATSAWRVPSTAADAPPAWRYGGFYTQDQVREIVRYAAERGITIVPEIEMPGHALAAIRAYPQFGAAPPVPGREAMWGVQPSIFNTDDATFTFLTDVLDEVMALFPSRYIHIGGDEAAKQQWRASPAVQARLHALGLKDEEALQSWFVARIGRYLEQHGRRLIGWDEILQDGIPVDATIMSWRGTDGAIMAARLGHDTVMTPYPTLYFPYREGPAVEDAPGRDPIVTLADVYAFDPTPATLDARQKAHVIGLQGSLWTEYVETDALATQLFWPRAAAIAALGWSPAGAHDYADFIRRLIPQASRLAALGSPISASAFRPTPAIVPLADGKLQVSLSNVAALPMRYTLNGAAPTAAATLYTGPLTVAMPAHLRVATMAGDMVMPGAIDRMLDRPTLGHRMSVELERCGPGNDIVPVPDDVGQPGTAERAMVNVQHPCWLFRHAMLEGVRTITLRVGQRPFNYQFARDGPPPPPPVASDGIGAFVVYGKTCDGPELARMSLRPALTNPGTTTLTAPLAAADRTTDLCITYTAPARDPMWMLFDVQLDPPRSTQE